jgi:serine/tyrosine/threonine adenylyltransferase
MSVAARSLFALDDSFARELEELSVPWQGAAVPAPRLLVLNEQLAVELGVDPEALRADHGVDVLAGNVPPAGASPVAQAYAGHQFGAYVPRLGDGRALLLGEVLDTQGRRRDVHLKGSGRTPFARGGDGKAVVGPMLREYVIGEAMHALGIPTSRALAVVATGEDVLRETVLPGAVLARVAASHIRVGTFQYAALNGGPELVRRLADHAIARHHPHAAEAENPYVAFYQSVLDTQASLMAQWMLVGFIHGVMNTDNMAISGETIDYGPCAFMDAFDPATVFSSIDQGGRYAYGNQPHIAQWNLARLAEALLPLIAGDTDTAVAAATGAL